MKIFFCDTWITWEKQIRNRSLSSKFNARLYELDYDGNQIARYVKSIFITLHILYKNRKGKIFVQNPSVVLALLAVSMKPFFQYKLIVDAHNGGIFPKTKYIKKIVNFIIRNSDFTIVTNQNLADHIDRSGGRALIIPDPLPTFDDIAILRSMPILRNKVVFICSWADDEPYFDVFKAAKLLPNFLFHVTGKSKGREYGFGENLPDNVVLTGYLPEQEYHELLATSGIIIDLTTRDNCLVCGAYEATSLERPFIVSNKDAIKFYFKRGCVYTENNFSSIVSSINDMYLNYEELKSQVKLGRLEIDGSWNELFLKAVERITAKN